ncbi:MAG: hypothetical protein DWQ01_07135 [Planctomycetota bacterium]|nr:MAG: hypothetical protein DWQ01_07135 [Planctomycetota bacterium]
MLHVHLKSLRVGLLLSFLAVPGLAQGGDDCADAQVISGTGTFVYDTGSATTDGPLENFEPTPRLIEMHNDVWFEWTAPKTSVYELSTCFPLTQWAATFVAIYKYGCPTGSGRAIAARGGYDCGLFTQLSFGTDAGATYLIRIGHSSESNRDDGFFEINEVSHPAVLGSEVNPGTGNTYHFLEASSWSVAQAAAVALGGNLVTVNDQAENDWLDSTFSNWGGQPRSFWLGYNDAENEGVWDWVSGETPGFTNWSSDGAPDNGNQFEHYAHFRRDWTDGTWNDLLGFPGVSFFYDEVHGVVEIQDGPTVTIGNLIGGQTASLDVVRCSPSGDVALGYSFAGPGPTSTPFGDVSLSLPISTLVFTADTNGEIHETVFIPAALSGRSIWVHGVDLVSGSLTNALALIIG